MYRWKGATALPKFITASLLTLPLAFGQVTLTTAQIAKRVSPSVVVIQGNTDSGEVLGSGFVVSKDGKIVTNLHVIKDLKDVSVQLAGGKTFHSISVLATDETHDLAIIQISGSDLSMLSLRNSNEPTVGEPVVVVGSPQGLEGTVTAGILSSVRDSGDGFKVLQTDAAVNPGNSGGPLVNGKGQVIGVISFKLRSSEGLTLAIPISYVSGLLKELHGPLSLAQLRSNVAQTSKNQSSEIMKEMSVVRMRSILQSMGFEFTEQPNTAGNPYLIFQLDGYKVTLATQATNLMLYSGFNVKVDLATVNGWNQKNRFSRAYLDTEGDPVVESDLDLSGGVTKEGVEAFIKQFRITVSGYVTTLKSRSSSELRTDSAPMHRKGIAASTKVKLPFGDFTLWVDTTKWKQSTADGGVLQFDNVNTEAYARIITERIGIPIDSLTEIALSNLKKSDPNAKIAFQEKRIVNGRQVVAMYIDATVSKLPIRYYGYYYGGTSGTIQAITYTVSTAFDRNVDEFTTFLDGLEITDQELPSPTTTSAETNQGGLLLLNSGTMGVTYDSKKWKQTQSKEGGRFEFDHVTGDGYAMVIAERIEIFTDSWPEIALANAKKVDPTARITFQEKRRVNGIEVWFLKLDAVSSGVPLTYYGYYYGGKAGSVQVLTYTGRTLVSEYEKDFVDFLNGFRLMDH
jgi:putative serine protease PepD